MSITSPISTQYQPNLGGASNQRFQDFKALQTALQSGNVSDAQTAFASFQKDLQGATQGAGGSSSSNPQSQTATDIQALSDALKSGDITKAQQAFATVKQDLKAAHAHHGHGHHKVDNDGDADDGGAKATGATATPVAPATDSTATILNALA